MTTRKVNPSAFRKLHLENIRSHHPLTPVEITLLIDAT